jgi:hypothetical protein
MITSIIDEIVRPEGQAQPLLWMAAGAMLAGAILIVLAGLGSLIGRCVRPPLIVEDLTADAYGWELGPLPDLPDSAYPPGATLLDTPHERGDHSACDRNCAHTL